MRTTKRRIIMNKAVKKLIQFPCVILSWLYSAAMTYGISTPICHFLYTLKEKSRPTTWQY
jgi:hypothetical protein